MANSENPYKAVNSAQKAQAMPEGRLVNGHLFVKNRFNEESEPKYKAEMAYDPATLEAITQAAFDFAQEAFGSKYGADPQLDIDGGVIVTMFKNGDEMAADRESNGKKGDAYKGKTIIRFDTIYNLENNDDDGGVYVANELAEPVPPAAANTVYNGCYGIVAFKFYAYEGNDSKTKKKFPAMKCYLQGFQKTQDGERFSGGNAAAGVFKPLARGEAGAAAAPGGRRSARKG